MATEFQFVVWHPNPQAEAQSAEAQIPRRFLPLRRRRALSVGGVPVFRRKREAPEARRRLCEANPNLGLSIHNFPQAYHMAGNFFIRLHVHQEERLVFGNGGGKFEEAAIGIDR